MYKISLFRLLHKIIRAEKSQTRWVGKITGSIENMKNHTLGISEDRW
jgi:hypothetical protein